jgi:hypothetical protein
MEGVAILEMDEQEQFLTEVLEKTVTIVNSVEEQYRQAAFPIILQKLININEAAASSNQASKANNPQETQNLRLPPGISVNQFFLKAAPDTHTGRFVCAAYYLLHTSKPSFTQADILEIYGRLRQPKPKNPTDVMNQCIRKAHIIDAPSSGDKQRTWVITPDGEKYVEGLLNGNTVSND